jgi:hypothetical protein
LVERDRDAPRRADRDPMGVGCGNIIWLQREAFDVVFVVVHRHRTARRYSSMGYWQAALVKVGMAQPGPKITAHDRAILEYVAGLR